MGLQVRVRDSQERAGESWSEGSRPRWCSQLQEPEKHIAVPMEGTAGQREAVAEELDSRIWNQIHNRSVDTFARVWGVGSGVEGGRGVRWAAGIGA